MKTFLQKTARGFTLIELLVVIAIIGVLASVVLASLNSARQKGEDSGAKANLANIRPQAAIVYDDTGSFATVCSDPTVAAAVTEAGGTCAADTTNGTGWGVEAPIGTSTDVWCVDYTGVSGEFAAGTIVGPDTDWTCD
jgi:prepilin-type N-terminal cleavage/methylation domain-containing protein